MKVKQILMISFFIIGAHSSMAQNNVVVGEVMYPKKNINQNDINKGKYEAELEKDHAGILMANSNVNTSSISLNDEYLLKV